MQMMGKTTFCIADSGNLTTALDPLILIDQYFSKMGISCVENFAIACIQGVMLDHNHFAPHGHGICKTDDTVRNGIHGSVCICVKGQVQIRPRMVLGVVSNLIPLCKWQRIQPITGPDFA